MANDRTRVIVIVTAAAVAATIGLAMFAGGSSKGQNQARSTMGAAPNVKIIPGESTSEKHKELLRESNKIKFDEAQKSGKTAVAVLVGSGPGSGDDPFSVSKPKDDKDLPKLAGAPEPPPIVEEPVKAPPPKKAPPAAAPEQAPPPPPPDPRIAQREEALKEMEKAKIRALMGLLEEWKPAGQRVERDLQPSARPAGAGFVPGQPMAPVGQAPDQVPAPQMQMAPQMAPQPSPYGAR
jgi:hypothetical protein